MFGKRRKIVIHGSIFFYTENLYRKLDYFFCKCSSTRAYFYKMCYRILFYKLLNCFFDTIEDRTISKKILSEISRHSTSDEINNRYCDYHVDTTRQIALATLFVIQYSE